MISRGCDTSVAHHAAASPPLKLRFTDIPIVITLPNTPVFIAARDLLSERLREERLREMERWIETWEEVCDG